MQGLIFLKNVQARTMEEGPKVPSEAWRREAPERRGGVGSGKFFSKINIKIAYFSAFLQEEMVSSAAESRQD